MILIIYNKIHQKVNFLHIAKEMIICMINPNIIFYDRNVEYIYRLNLYLSEKYSDYNIIYFTDDSKFINFCKEFDGIGIFVIAENCMCGSLQSIIKGEILLLVDEDNVVSVNDYNVIYRYQASDNLISSILNYYADKIVLDSNRKYFAKNDCKILGIYSPVSRCGKTELSIELAKSLKEDILLINFEEFSDLTDRLNIKGDFTISDLMYFFIKNTDNLSIKLDAVVKEYNNFHIIPPLDNPEDLYDIEIDIWVNFILSISGLGKYNYIILDISNAIRYFTRIFDICSYIFVPYIGGKQNLDKLQKFDTYIDSKKDNSINDKIFKICMDNKTGQDIVNEIHTIMGY